MIGRWLLMLMVLSASWPVLSVDCPGGVYLSPVGDDVTGSGTLEEPLLSFPKALEILHNRQEGHAMICLLPGTYHDNPGTISANPPFFTSITVTPSNLTAPLPLLHTHYHINTATFELSHVSSDTLIVQIDMPPGSHCDLHIHDLYNASSSFLSVFLNSSQSSSRVVLERVYDVSLEVSSLENNIVDVSLADSILNRVHLEGGNSFELTKSVLQSYIIVSALSVTITHCNASHLFLNDDFSSGIYRDNLISIFPPPFGYVYNVTILSNRFINNTINCSGTASILMVNDYFYYLLFQDNYFSCNLGLQTYGPWANYFPLTLLPATTIYNGLPGIIVNNFVDPTCPQRACDMGTVPMNQGLSCGTCPKNFISLDGKECVPCPPGTENHFSMECYKCSGGYYNPHSNSSCIPCIAGTPNENATSCDPCPAGYFAVYGTCRVCGHYDYMIYKECPACPYLQDPPHCDQLSSEAKIMIIGVVDGVLVLVGLIIICYCGRRNFQFPSNSGETSEAPPETPLETNLPDHSQSVELPVLLSETDKSPRPALDQDNEQLT